MATRSTKFDVPGIGKVSGRVTEAAKKPAWTFVYAPGASANLNEAFALALDRLLPPRGIAVVRFQFPYAEAGRKAPDRPPVLEATWNAVIEAVRQPRVRLCVGGRSMGGRIASQVVAAGTAVDALCLFAYPLHPPGKPEQLRVEHLPKLKVPALFVSGSSDAFGSPDELRAAANKVRGSKLHFLDGADHGFAVKKASGRTRDDVQVEAISTLADWLLGLK
jgi:predicted alpha/beta-hydrolase family hydrolase